jgi:hypothetical protein
MNETFFLGINLLLIFSLWRFCWKKSILDNCRDELFGTRDKVRDYFIANNLSLAHPGYKQLRDMLNGYLRFTEKATLINFFCFASELNANEKTAKIYNEILIERDNAFENDVLKRFAHGIRSDAALTLRRYMVYTSLIGVLLISTVSVCVLLQRTFIGTNAIILKGKSYVFKGGLIDKLIKTVGIVALGSATSSNVYADDAHCKAVAGMEKYSLEFTQVIV